MTTIKKEKKTYNGWTNYETWNVKLWMDNDQGSYEYWKEISQQIYDNAKSASDETKEEAATREIADALKTEHEDNTPTVTGIYADLLNAALSEVDWYEIAESLMDDEVEKD